MRKVQGSPQPLGVTVGSGRVNFAVDVPEGKSCELLVYRAGSTAVEYSWPMDNTLGEVHYLALEGLDAQEYEYNYSINGKVCLDPYVREIRGRREFGKKEPPEEHTVRGRIGLGPFDWGEDARPHIPLSDVVAYSLHVRGFTKHPSSRVKHKGTFAGIVEKIPYMKELGINQIQCMPVYEFREYVGGKQNYWGYGKGFYFAPKAAYAASLEVCREFKEMVKACHGAGIEVVLEMPFEEGILLQTAVECLRYYMLEYHIDGFVVNPYNVAWDCLIKDPFLKGVKIFKKEDWFQNVMRRFLKGDEGMVREAMYALRRNTKEDGCCNYITAHTGFTLYDLVSYDGKHNEDNGENNQDGPDYNYSWNCGGEEQKRKKQVELLRRNQICNAFFLLLSAQGTPCLLAGDEFENTQKGNNNVYCQDNELSWLNWNKLKNNDTLFQYVKELIALRKSHAALHRPEPLSGTDQGAYGLPDVSYHGESAWQPAEGVASRQLGVMYCGGHGGDTDCFVAYNMHWIEHSFALPSPGKKKKWYLAADTQGVAAKEAQALKNQKSIELKPRSIVFLVGK